MNLNEIIENDYIAAYKEKNSLKVSVLRLLKTAIKNRLVEKKLPHGKLEDDEILDLILKQAKQRKDSIILYKQALREDLALKEENELAILQLYLPAPLTEEQIEKLIVDTINKLDVSATKNKGQIISYIMKEYKGRIDGKLLSEKVNKKLN